MSEPIFITVAEFANRMMISTKKAYEIARSQQICEAGIAVRIDPTAKSGGAIRINWLAYLELIKGCPALPEHKRLHGISPLAEQAKAKRARQSLTRE